MFFVCSPDWLFSLFLLFVYFSSLGLSLFQRVTVALPRTSCCLYTCTSMRVFLLSPPPPPPLLYLSLPSVCLSVCQSVSVSHPNLPPLPLPLPLSLPLFVPLFLYSIPPSNCVLCPLLGLFVCLFVFVFGFDFFFF